MKIQEKELRKMIREAIKNKLQNLNENKDFTAYRNIEVAAQQASMGFEQDIIKGLDLVKPDQLPPETQRIYHEVVEEMKTAFIEAVKTALQKLSRFPRNDQQMRRPLK